VLLLGDNCREFTNALFRAELTGVVRQTFNPECFDRLIVDRQNARMNPAELHGGLARILMKKNDDSADDVLAPKQAEHGNPQGVESPHQNDSIPVVGIGASAGGLAALKSLFSHIPGNTGQAYVIVVHLSPEHESHLAELLQPHIQMPVQQVNETVQIEPNRVYVIPPNANLDAIDTHLRLSELESRRGGRAPIDHFFRTLSKAHDGRGVGDILTGTGSDGTLGLREIKEAGGLCIVQDPNEAEYDGMPQSAIATGMVDLILPLAEIPNAIAKFVHTRPRLPFPPDGGEEVDGELQQSLAKLLSVMGHTVETAADGVEALERGENFKPQLVIMDLSMPRMDGFEAARRMRDTDWGKAAVLAALTGWGQNDDGDSITKAGFDRHVLKPVEKSQLQEIIASVKPVSE
jgi:chemotaxis response regulator CheB